MSISALGYQIDSSQAVAAAQNLDRMNDAAGRAGTGADHLDRRAQVLRATFARLRPMVASVGAAIAGAFAARAIIGGIADFDQSMSRVQAITRATAGDMERMREIAIRLGASTEFSATQAADGLQFLGMAGFSAAESMAAIPQVLDLATAAGMGLGEAADTASNIMSAFSIQATNAANVTDVLAAASTRANTNVTQLGQAISTAGPIAATMGIALEDTAAAIGVMSDAGIQGERAGTALRAVLASLAGPTSQAQAALARYGLTAADVDPTTRSLADIMDTLRERGLSTADAMTIFGREAASGALVLVQGSARLREFGAELRQVEGAASQMAATMRDNLRGDLNGLSSAVSTLIIALGDAGLTAALRATIQTMTDLTRFIADNLNPIFNAFTVVVVALTATQIPALVAILARLPAVFIAAGGAAGILNAALGIAAGLITALGGPISILLGIIAGTAAAVFLFRDRIKELVGPTDDVKNAQNALNQAMAVFHESAAPSAAAAAIDAANAYREQAAAARDAAASELARIEALIAAQEQMGMDPEAALFLGGQQSTAIVNLTRASNALTNATIQANAATRQVTGTMSERMTAAADAARTVTVEVEGLGDALRDLEIPPIPPAGGGAAMADDFANRIATLQQQFQTERELVDAWYQETQAILNDRRAMEILGEEGHRQLLLRVEEEYQRRLAEIRAASQSQQLGEMAGFFGSLAEVAQQGGEEMTRVARVFSATQALINTYLAASQALADPRLGFFAKFAAVARVIASGMGLVNAIRSSGNATSRPSAAVGAVSAPTSVAGATQQAQAPIRQVVVDLRGADWAKNIVQPIMEQIYEATRDGERVVFAR